MALFLTAQIPTQGLHVHVNMDSRLITKGMPGAGKVYVPVPRPSLDLVLPVLPGGGGGDNKDSWSIRPLTSIGVLRLVYFQLPRPPLQSRPSCLHLPQRVQSWAPAIAWPSLVLPPTSGSVREGWLLVWHRRQSWGSAMDVAV